jgi:ParB family chromosome partitioning protein
MERLEEISIAGVGIPESHRGTNDATVREIARSIARIGLLSPIGVTKGYDLIYGRHRLEACEFLEWEKIPAFLYDVDDIANEMATHAENLFREELTALERAGAITRMKELYEATHAQSRGGRPEKTSTETLDNMSKVSASNAIAEQIGKTGRTVRRDIAIGEAIPDDVAKTLEGTPTADNQAELARLAKLPPAKQRKAAARIKSGKAKTVAEAVPDEVAAKLARHSAPKSGQVKNNASLFTTLISALGGCLRQIDALHRAIPNCPLHDLAIEYTKKAQTHVETWKKAAKV